MIEIVSCLILSSFSLFMENLQFFFAKIVFNWTHFCYENIENIFILRKRIHLKKAHVLQHLFKEAR